MDKKGVVVESQVIWWGIAIAVIVIMAAAYFLFKSSMDGTLGMVFDKIRYGG